MRMDAIEDVTAYCDGGSRGNPGPAGFGVSIEDEDGRPVAELSEFLGVKTNNFAEYSGLLAALEYALTHGVKRLRVVADSELMVKQMKGQYRVNSPDLRPLWEEARRRAARLEGFEIRHVLRGKNRRADALANKAMDSGMGRTTREIAASSPVRPSASTGKTPPIGGRAGAGGAGTAGAAGTTTRAAAPAVSRSGSPSAPGDRSADARASQGGRNLRPVKGFVKNGVVHLLEGELPENCFVRVIPE
jgi:probable phosphoglycerate mutase